MRTITHYLCTHIRIIVMLRGNSKESTETTKKQRREKNCTIKFRNLSSELTEWLCVLSNISKFFQSQVQDLIELEHGRLFKHRYISATRVLDLERW